MRQKWEGAVAPAQPVLRRYWLRVPLLFC